MVAKSCSVVPDCCWFSLLTCVMVAKSVWCLIAVGTHHWHVWCLSAVGAHCWYVWCLSAVGAHRWYVWCLIAVGAHHWHVWWWQVSQCYAWLLWVLTIDMCDGGKVSWFAFIADHLHVWWWQVSQCGAWLLLLLTVNSHSYVSLEMDNAAVWDVVKWWTVNEPLVLIAQKKLSIMLILVFGLVCFPQTVEIFFPSSNLTIQEECEPCKTFWCESTLVWWPP